MEVRFTRHALLESMPDEKIGVEEVVHAVRAAELRVRLSEDKFRFRRRDLEVICERAEGHWKVITCYRLRE